LQCQKKQKKPAAPRPASRLPGKRRDTQMDNVSASRMEEIETRGILTRKPELKRSRSVPEN
jgi:hypothetical protein